jgi:hypothetical protein
MQDTDTNIQTETSDALITGQPFQPQETLKNSNVLFVPAQHTELTKVFVSTGAEKTEIDGVVRARLDYDPELGFPTLHLEIVNPVIGIN